MELLSQMWSLLGLLTVLQNILPSQILSLLHLLWQLIQDFLTPYIYFDIPEFLGSSSIDPNHLYRHAHLYLHHSLHNNQQHISTTPRLTLSLNSFMLSPNQSISDSFNNTCILWTHHVDTLPDSLEERRSFTIRLPKHSFPILKPYLTHVNSSALTFDLESRDRRIYTNSSAHAWSSVPFGHPARFNTLALDPALKSFLKSDLDSFTNAGEFYKSVGRPWKRGYLLYGPPGSGKSSLIAAIANHLKYDVYDLELTRVPNNSDLRSLLVQTTNRSVIVIEDIDCSLHLTGNRALKKKHRNNINYDGDSDEEDKNFNGRVTLSGLLNFTDGLWSCCGEERVIIFTTNYKDGIDEALLRAGRMDVHVKLGECGVHVLREMIERYVEDDDDDVHDLVEMAEKYVKAGAGMTVAEVGEVLMKNRGGKVTAVRELVKELKMRAGAEMEDYENLSSPESKGKRKTWEGKIRVLGGLRSLTKSDSEKRGV